MRTAKLAAHSFVKLRRIVKEADEKEGTTSTDGEELPESLSSALPTFMETFWSLSSHDITGTLDKVIARVLSDGGVSLEERGLRAERLRKLGQALQALSEATETATATSSGPQGTAECRRFEKAFVASMANRA
ncbi:DJP1 [Symbiodinium sp. CCMP2592]|nr:DJP1 [Symbiodinium sp. CCMP2592]